MDKISQIELGQIENDIKIQEGKRTTGITLLIISIFCLWPLAIVGGVMLCKANGEIKKLLNKKQEINVKLLMGESNINGQN